MTISFPNWCLVFINVESFPSYESMCVWRSVINSHTSWLSVVTYSSWFPLQFVQLICCRQIKHVDYAADAEVVKLRIRWLYPMSLSYNWITLSLWTDDVWTIPNHNTHVVRHSRRLQNLATLLWGLVKPSISKIISKVLSQYRCKL